METRREVFIFASPEIQGLLVDNQVDLVELLLHEGIVVDRGLARNLENHGVSTPKDLTTVFLATAGVILSLTPILTKVIAALSHKQIETHEMILIPVEDSQGNVVRNTAGEPILQWVRRTHIIESQKEVPEVTFISLKGPVGIELTFRTSPEETQQKKLQLPTSSSAPFSEE